MNRLTLFVCLGLSALCTTGCAIGREHAYHTQTLHVQPAQSGASSIAVAVHDRRTEVVTGDKDPDFVGLSRGGWGNPFDVTTESDAPLAADMAATIARSMQSAGYQVRVVPVAPGEQPAKAASRLLGSGAKRALLLRLDKWKSDTYQNTSLHYDIDLVVLDGAGKPLAHEHRQGNDNLGGSVWSPGAHADKAVAAFFQLKLEDLLNSPSVVQALRGSRPAAASGAVPRS